MNDIDWVEEWKRIQDQAIFYKGIKEDQEESYWSKYASDYYEWRVTSENYNKTLDFIKGFLTPSIRVLEVGCGPGIYTIPISPLVKEITVVEPSPSMLKVLKEKAQERGIDNINIIQDKWENVSVEPHDVVLALGMLYAFYDIDEALLKLISSTDRYLLISSGFDEENDYMELIGRLGLDIGPIYISPDFIVLYNILYQLKLYGDVKINWGGYEQSFNSLEEVKEIWIKRLDIPPEKHFELEAYLKEKFKPQDGKVVRRRRGARAMIIIDKENLQ